MRDKTHRRRFDLIAFDWDGTLFDSTGLIVRCIQAACRDLGMPEPSDVQAAYVIGLGLMDALRHAVPDLAVERYPELGRRYRHHYMARQHEIVLFDGTREMLASLKARNHWLAVATGKSRLGLNEALDSAQLRQFFDSTRTADETASKPDPLMLLELMGELGTRARAHADDRRHHARPAAGRQCRRGLRWRELWRPPERGLPPVFTAFRRAFDARAARLAA